MSYSIRPYLRCGLFRNLRVKYTVDLERQLHILKKGDHQTVRLEGMTTSVKRGNGFRGLVRRILDLGDIELQGSPGTFLLSNIPRASAFKQALDGKHSATTKVIREIPTPAWHEGVELERFDVIFPPIPEAIYDAIYYAKGISHHLRSGSAEVGKWVRKGETICILSHYPDDRRLPQYGDRPGAVIEKFPPGSGVNPDNTTIVVAPFDGMITHKIDPMFPSSMNCWGAQTGEFETEITYYSDRSVSPCFFAMRPVKGECVDSSFRASMTRVLSWCQSLISNKERLEEVGLYSGVSSYCEPEEFKRLIAEAIEHVRNHKPIIRNHDKAEQE